MSLTSSHRLDRLVSVRGETQARTPTPTAPCYNGRTPEAWYADYDLPSVAEQAPLGQTSSRSSQPEAVSFDWPKGEVHTRVTDELAAAVVAAPAWYGVGHRTLVRFETTVRVKTAEEALALCWALHRVGRAANMPWWSASTITATNNSRRKLDEGLTAIGTSVDALLERTDLACTLPDAARETLHSDPRFAPPTQSAPPNRPRAPPVSGAGGV